MTRMPGSAFIRTSFISGIETVELIKAVGLDIEGAPVEEILRECEEEIERRFRK